MGSSREDKPLKVIFSSVWFVEDMRDIRIHQSLCQIYQDFESKETLHFCFTGTDFAGPLFVKNRKSDMRKVYICLFTCATSRAIHLQFVNDLTADTLLHCFRRLVSRRGIPSLIVTDNAKTFTNAAKRLAALFELQEVIEFMHDKGIKWNFNLPKAPW